MKMREERNSSTERGRLVAMVTHRDSSPEQAVVVFGLLFFVCVCVSTGAGVVNRTVRTVVAKCVCAPS